MEPQLKTPGSFGTRGPRGAALTPAAWLWLVAARMLCAGLHLP